jgi:polyisoprenoid-binding protein YceI
MPIHRTSAIRLTIFLLAAYIVCASASISVRVLVHAQTVAPQVALELDPAQSKINWKLSATAHTVHGTFGLTKGRIEFDPAGGKAGGEIIADARSGESGDSGRDKNMHEKVLESAKYPAVTFSPDRVDGKVAMQGASKVQIHGILEIHGVKHELTVPAEVNFAGERWTAKSTFDIPYVQWGMKDPSNFFLRVGATVSVELDLAGRVNPPHAN